jgi:tetratricopeptide (TPR) repeat protein
MNKRIPAIFVVLVLAGFFAQSTFGQTSKGIELYNSGEFQKAEKVLRDALKGNPSDLSANYYLGLSMLLQKKQNEALAIFLKVKMNRDKMDQKARQAVSEYQIQLALARTNLEMKHFDEGWKNLEAAEKEDAKAADVFVYRGVYYLDQEKHKEALKELEKAISLDPKNAYAYYYQGMAFFHSGQGAEAGAAFKKFLELAPHAPDADEAKRLVTILC